MYHLNGGETVLPCDGSELFDRTLDWFLDSSELRFARGTFRVRLIYPADRPSVAVIAGPGGLALRLEDAPEKPNAAAPIEIRLTFSDATFKGETSLTAPNGTQVTIAPEFPPLVIPPTEQSFVLTRAEPTTAGAAGRAGMLYRDLIPSRLGGSVIASHITILGTGPIPDYVHHHSVRYQLIYCRKGWVKVVYEDQGDPFIMSEGDCVLQPPNIRHRVLESGDDVEVIEVGSPAIHPTHGDLLIDLPTKTYAPLRVFGGQRFVRHIARDANWVSEGGFMVRDTTLLDASAGVVSVRVFKLETSSSEKELLLTHSNDFRFYFLLEGSAVLTDQSASSYNLANGDSWTVPKDLSFCLLVEPGSQILEVFVPEKA